jgi:hypothetical protein
MIKWIHHLLGLASCVRATGFWRRVIEWDDGVSKVTLFAAWLNSHIVDVQSILCKAFVG